MKKIISCFLIFCLITVFCSCNVGVASFNFYGDSEKYSVGNVSYEAGMIKKIEVNWVEGNIEILKSEDGTFSVSENSDDLDSEERMHYYLNGAVLIIQYCESGYNSEWISGEDKNLTLVIPDGIDIDIDNVSAGIIFSSDIVFEDVDISNVSGNVEIKSLKAESFDLENVSGEFYADEIIAYNVDAESVSGNIKIHTLGASVLDAETVSGEIKIGICDKTNIKIDSVSGAVYLISDKNIGMEIEFSSVSGNLRSDIPHTQNGDIYLFGSDDAVIRVETVSGNLYIK